ncbi:rhodanese-like domain-containing protein [Candidatus Poriferisodalis sp.]|uniref:rhodanese-like domain-containing protein n=1 Tax=Candidatus Poriferisodalis sp. TaxID=3101277 RepID=UPI003B02E190
MPEPQRKTVHDLLAEARAGLDRISPAELSVLLGAVASAGTGRLRVIDIRSRDQREANGIIEGSEPIDPLVLEWRIDGASGFAEGTAADFDDRLVIVCNEGYSSSLAAARLQDLGFGNATDLDGGMAGWKSHGLPVIPPPAAGAETAG